MIEKNIFQTHKTKEHIAKNLKLVWGTNSWKSLSPEYTYHFYNNEECDSFMKNEYGGPIYKAYKRSPLNVMKADIWRYCIIHKYGGIYADSDTRLFGSPDIFQKEGALFVGVPENNVHLCQWIFAAPKSSPVLESIIEYIAEIFYDVDNFFEPHIVHRLTGPGAFSAGIDKYLRKNNLPTYADKNQYANYPDKRLYIYPGNQFHEIKVLHMFSGYWDGGWTIEKDNYVKNNSL